MKNIRSICFLAFLCLITGTYAQETPETQPSPIERINQLEASLSQENADLEDRLKAVERFQQSEEKELDLKFDNWKREQEGWYLGLVIGGIAIFASCIGGVVFIRKTVMKAVAKKLKKQIVTSINEELPKLMKTQVDEQLEKFFTAKKPEIYQMIEMHERQERYKEEKKLLVLCNNQEAEVDIKKLLKEDLGFKKVDTRIISEYQKIEGYDLVIVNHENRPAEGEVLTDGLVIKLMQKDLGRLIYLYFGTYNHRLNTEVGVTNFANSRFTLYPRILDLLNYVDTVNDNRNAKQNG